MKITSVHLQLRMLLPPVGFIDVLADKDWDFKIDPTGWVFCKAKTNDAGVALPPTAVKHLTYVPETPPVPQVRNTTPPVAPIAPKARK